MFRTFLVMTLALLLAAGGDAARSLLVVDSVVSAHSASHDCCPPCEGPPAEDDAPCCDIGCSCTCAAGVVALSPPVAPLLHPGASTRALRVSSPVALLTDHDRGPPPTPPPIA